MRKSRRWLWKRLRLWLIAKTRRIKEWHWVPEVKEWEDLEDINPSWRDLFYLDLYGFSEALKVVPYFPKRTSSKGRTAFPLDKSGYFFKNLPYGRKSEEWARIWVKFLREKGIICEEWLVSDIEDSEVKTVTISRTGNGYGLFDFEFMGFFPSVEQALQAVSMRNDSDIIAVEYKTWS